MKLRLSLVALLALVLFAADARARFQDPPAPAPAPAPQRSAPDEIVPAALGETPNVHRAGDLWFSAQITPADVAVLKERGIRRVITLRKPGEIRWDEAGALGDAGIELVAVPFGGPEELTDGVFDSLRRHLAGEQPPTLLHCGSASRVGGAWLPFRVLDEGVPLERALAEAKTIGLANAGYEERALAYVAREREKSVKQGINDSFTDPDLDVDEFIARFEVESREVYAARRDVLAATGVVPGMRIADVGAGTGFYTMLFADAVGPEGWVFAIDIAPRFVQHVLASAAAKHLRNVTGVLCQADTIGLPPRSVELAFVCDTYHHFEFPASTLASIERALVPGGRLVVIDFERIEGVSRDWILGHVRAGKETFRAEIERAGLRFVREVEIEGLAENYFLEFRKPE